MTIASAADPFAPPDDATVDQAVRDFARAVKRAYGDRLKGVYLFGSRARGDHTPDSDADVAIVLADDGWDFWTEKMRLAGLTYDPLVETGADIQAWPVAESEWRNPSFHRNRLLALAMRKDAVRIEAGDEWSLG